MIAMASDLHQDRRRAESFGGAAERYDRSRPTYPEALLDRVIGPDPVSLDVLDVGCGTGIAARLMAARGASVLGVEADARMAEVARRQGTPVEVARFEDWDPAGRRFDRVTAGQVWHWVDPVAGAARAASVLRPEGRLCLFWNIGRPPTQVQEAFDRVYREVAPGADGYSVILGYAADKKYEAERAGIRATPGLSGPTEHRFEWSRTYTRDEWLDQLPTHSDHAAMAPDTLAQVLDRIGAIIDRFGGAFEMEYSTLLLESTRDQPPG
jgi:SAM-dependent methyltransferase